MVGSTYIYVFIRLLVFKVGGGGHTLFIFYLYTNFDFLQYLGPMSPLIDPPLVISNVKLPLANTQEINSPSEIRFP